MAKPKPTSVIRHEIILGKVEREMAEQLVLTQSLKNVVQPIALAGGVVVGYYGIELGARYLLNKWDWLLGPEFVTKSDGTQVKNPLHGVPIVGGLFGKGIGLGPDPADPIKKGSFWDLIFSINPNWRNR